MALTVHVFALNGLAFAIGLATPVMLTKASAGKTH